MNSVYESSGYEKNKIKFCDAPLYFENVDLKFLRRIWTACAPKRKAGPVRFSTQVLSTFVLLGFLYRPYLSDKKHLLFCA